MAWIKRGPEREQRVITALRAGNTRGAAAGYAGIEQSTLERWMHRSAAFAAAVKLAEHEAEVTVVSNLLARIQAGDVRAMTFWLERRRRESWSESIDVRASGAVRIIIEDADHDEHDRRNGDTHQTAAEAHGTNGHR